MIRQILLAGAAILFISACGNEKQAEKASVYHYDFSRLEGSYLGSFGDSGDIRIVLRYVTESNAVGFDLHKGLRRNISGQLDPAVNGFHFLMQEPGDHPHDGVFDFTIDTNSYEMTGTWKPAKRSRQTVKELVLKKRSPENNNGEEYYPTVFQDSLGELYFEENGLCLYRYYPRDSSGNAAEQYSEIKGNWNKDGRQYIVEWQRNDIFLNRKCIFRVEGDDDDYYEIRGEGRSFYNNEF